MRAGSSRLGLGAIGALSLFLLMASPAGATITPVTNDTAGATTIAQTLPSVPATVTGATWDAVPLEGTPNGTGDASPPLGGFPTNGASYGILTSGNVNFADDPNDAESSGQNLHYGPVRGASDYDVSILEVAIVAPPSTNCLGVDFKFLSEEYPEFVGFGYSDSFIAELDTSDWTTTSGSNPPTAPNNFAFDSSGNPISINSPRAAGIKRGGRVRHDV